MFLPHSLSAVSAMLMATQALGAAVPTDFNVTESITLEPWGVGNSEAAGDMSIMSGCDQGSCPDNQPEG